MSKNMHEMSTDEILEAKTIGLDDVFEFRCKACGKCCKNRNDLILTPYDVYRISSYFGRSPEEIVQRYCDVYKGENSHLPIVGVVPVPPDNACSFLHNKKCSVHEKKPVVCRVYPLARLRFIDDDSAAKFQFHGASCKHTPQTVTVREWIGDVASDEAEQAGKLWLEVVTTLYQLVEKTQDMPPDVQDMIFSILFGGIYLAYDVKQPFLPQLRINFNKIKDFLEDMVSVDESG